MIFMSCSSPLFRAGPNDLDSQLGGNGGMAAQYHTLSSQSHSHLTKSGGLQSQQVDPHLYAFIRILDACRQNQKGKKLSLI